MSLAGQLSSISTSIAGARGFIAKLEGAKKVASAGPQARSMLADASKEIAYLRKEITAFQKTLKKAPVAKAPGVVKTVKEAPAAVAPTMEAEEADPVEAEPGAKVVKSRKRAPRKKTAI
jgi:hypothetical protein